MSFQEYETREDLMDELADLVASELDQAIAANGVATLAVPGGTTPAPFLQALSDIDLEWERIRVILTDERFVPEDSDRSNTRLIKKNLLVNEGKRAAFVPYVVSDVSAEKCVELVSENIDAVLPIDVLIVGMGDDMHTASLFPDSPDLAAALSDDAPALMTLRAEKAGEPRISLTANALRTARFKHVLIVGKDKKLAYEKAMMTPTEMLAPVRVVLVNDRPAVVHYAN